MILLPDEDGEPVGVQVKALIGAALRQSVAEAGPSRAFEQKLAAALSAAASKRDAAATGQGTESVAEPS